MAIPYRTGYTYQGNPVAVATTGIPVSTVPAAIAALTSQIQAQVTGNEGANAGAVAVFTGDEDANRPNDRIIVATNVDRRVRHDAFIGSYQTGALEEDYVIDVLVSSYSGDPDGVANMTRAWTLAGYVETAVRTDPSLGSTIVVATPAGTKGGQSYWTDSPTGRQTDIIVMVEVKTIN